MAENESLDLDDPYGRRWGILVRSIRKHEPFDTVIGRVRKALYGGPRNALKQTEKYGVTLQMLLENRNSPQALRQFTRQTQGHDYVQLFADVAKANPQSDTPGLVQAFVAGVWETVEDRIAHRVVGSDGLTSFADVRSYLDRVAERIAPDVDRIARNLAEDPSWKPRMPRGSKGQGAETTTEMLSMSLLGN